MTVENNSSYLHHPRSSWCVKHQVGFSYNFSVHFPASRTNQTLTDTITLRSILYNEKLICRTFMQFLSDTFSFFGEKKFTRNKNEILQKKVLNSPVSYDKLMKFHGLAVSKLRHTPASVRPLVSEMNDECSFSHRRRYPHQKKDLLGR